MNFDLNAFMQYLAFGGGSLAAMSFIAEYWTWFQNLSANQKKFGSFLGSAVIGSGAYAFLTYAPAGLIGTLTPFFAIVAVSFAGYFGVSVFHSFTKAPKA